jgi:hypothetical protein
MNSDPGDWIGQGQQYDLAPPADTFAASGNRNAFAFSVDQGAWTGSFHPGQGDIFTPGTTYTGAQRDAFRGSAPGMEVDGPSRGCNTISGDFQVLAATFAPDGTMQTFAIKFDQYCDGSSAGLHGEFDWREGDTTPPAPWMGPGGPCSPPSCNSGSGGSGPGGSGGTGTATPGSSSASGAGGSAPSPVAGAAGSSGNGSGGQASEVRQRELTASLRASERRLGRAMRQLRRNHGSTKARKAALADLRVQVRDISGLRKLIADSRSSAERHPTRRQVLDALSTLRRIARSERRALETAGGAAVAAALRVADRNAGAKRHALAVASAAG